ncbi:MAG: hypothetical protein ACUVRD_08150 [Bacteroidia bacterium]
MRYGHIGIGLVLASLLWGREIMGNVPRRAAPRTANNCAPATSSVQLDINNVRCLIHNGGDMWWDLVGDPRYEIPKVPPGVPAKHSMFASSIWVGGLDPGGRLRLAAQTYRQSGNDYFPGPLSISTGTTDAATCSKWDKHFIITREEINNFRAEFQATGGNPNLGNYPAIINWPAINTDPGFDRFLAPFVDVNNDGDYTPAAGDYPDVPGDMAIWWVINDKGNIHTETGANQIGIEIQNLAFAFQTTDAVNNMTFYKYKIINRGSLALTQTYMAVWVDSDLGNYSDDYVGCDTARGLGYCYNGDPNDDPPTGYGLNPPSIGTDFFQGPIGDNGQRLKMTNFVYYENDFSPRGNPTLAVHFYNYMRSIWKDGRHMVLDCGNAYGSSGPPTNYVYFAYPGGASAAALCPFAAGIPIACQNEADAGNSPFDRRYLQSAGPFTLQPGAVNEIIVGVPWARDEAGAYAPGGNGQIGSVCALLQADDVAQALFDNNFQLVEGPDAPDLEIVELDRELILNWGYKSSVSNNFREDYQQVDPVLKAQYPGQDSIYRFEGYILYQLRDASVGPGDLDDPAKAAIVAQCDIKNGITTIVNREVQNVPGYGPAIVDKVMVTGKNEGLFHSIRVLEDKFAERTDPRLVNYRRYYFAIVAYAYNGAPDNPVKFIRSKNNVKSYVAVPHKVDSEKMGTALASAYGDGTSITRIAGAGNSGNKLLLDPKVESQIFSPPYKASPTYAPGFGPIGVEVVDPKSVKAWDYKVVVFPDTTERVLDPNRPNTYLFKEWELYGRPTGSAQPWELVYTSYYAVAASEWNTGFVTRFKNRLERFADGTKRIIPGHGIAVSVKNNITARDPGVLFFSSNPSGPYASLCPVPAAKRFYFLEPPQNGFIGAEMVFDDPSKSWLSWFSDEEANWIISNTQPRYEPCQETGGTQQPPIPTNILEVQANYYDGISRSFEKILQGGWSPYVLSQSYDKSKPTQIGMRLDFCAPEASLPADDPNNICLAPIRRDAQTNPYVFVTLDKLPSIEVVITKDPSKWSKCLVIESSPGDTSYTDIVGASRPRFAKYRRSMTLQSDGTLISDPNSLQRGQHGFSYFPGYAVNLETGQRVNIFFAEASWYKEDKGDDMLFNPTSSVGADRYAFGGRHWIFVTTQPYDECQSLARHLSAGNNLSPIRATASNPVSYKTAQGDKVTLDSAYKYVAWVGLPRVSRKEFEFKSYKGIPTDVRIRIWVNKSMRPDAQTGTLPTFQFSNQSIAVRTGDAATAKNALDLIKVVPNPYYGRSGIGRGRYEISQLDTRVKITNLPQKCTIRIFTLNGYLVRTYRKDSDAPDQEWDLKNEQGVPIASGIYIIHVDAGELGQKVLKFYGIMPQTDLNNF